MLLQDLETKRLIIRRFAFNDWPAVYAYTSDPQVMTYMPEGALTRALAREYVERNLGHTAEAYALVLKDERLLIGHIIYHPWFAPLTEELGWVMHPAYQRRGYASEAACALLDYSFIERHMHRVVATCQPENIASYRVMEKIGMRREGHFRQCLYRDENLWWDEYFYAILRDEWLARFK